MSNSKDATSPPRESGSAGLVVVLVAASILAYFVFRSNGSAESQLAGVPLPPLEVAGWFNTEKPVRTEDLLGKVVLLDCWFVGCPPCRAAMPRLVEFNKRFRDQDFQLIGLTIDTGADADDAKAFVKSIPGLDWPIGYGAEIPVQGILGIYQFPTMILFDKSGRSVWTGYSEHGLEAATIKALAEDEG